MIDPNNIGITGDVDLQLGSEAFSYDENNGIIDASTFTGDLHVFIGTGSQTVIGGLGDDHIELMANQALLPDLIDLSVGGSDTVEFHAVAAAAFFFVNSGNYTTITDFDIANDTVAIDVAGGPNITLWATNGALLTGGEAVSIYPLILGVDDGLAGVNNNFIKITNDLSSVGFSLQATFNFYMASLGGTDIGVAAAADEILMAFHDTNAANGGQIVLFTVAPGADNTINSGDDVDMVSIIADKTFAEFQAFGTSGLAFVG